MCNAQYQVVSILEEPYIPDCTWASSLLRNFPPAPLRRLTARACLDGTCKQQQQPKQPPKKLVNFSALCNPITPLNKLNNSHLTGRAVDDLAAAPLLHVAEDDIPALLVRVAGDADAQLPEQPRRMGRGRPRLGPVSFVVGGIRFLVAGLGLVLGSGTALPGTGEIQVGAHDVGYAGCWVATRGRS